MQCRLFYCIMENEQRGMITFILAVCGNVDYVYSFPQSPPSRAAWIEMYSESVPVPSGTSPPSRAAWIEIACARDCGRAADTSPPSRAAWIEIRHHAPDKESARRRRLHGRRGLKFQHNRIDSMRTASPPSRAAWIEITSQLSI